MPQRSRGSKTIGAEQHSAVRNRGEWRVKLDELTERKNDNNLLKRPAFYSIIRHFTHQNDVAPPCEDKF